MKFHYTKRGSADLLFRRPWVSKSMKFLKTRKVASAALTEIERERKKIRTIFYDDRTHSSDCVSFHWRPR